MTNSKVYALAAVGLLFCIGGSASGAGSTPTQTSHPAQAQDRSANSSANTAESQEIQAPVLRVISVEVLRSTHGPTLDIIRVRGLASTSGWEEAELVPLTRGRPADGILELVLVARAPNEAMEATGFEAIEAIFPLDASHPFKGVSVHSASDSITLNELPGYAEGKPAGEDCSKCVGKIFVPKGAAAPAGKSASELVKEEQLPASTRVIRHSDGIPNAESNPNRLTIVLAKDGTISTAIWD
jgi:hypothetical protein